jgi:hypothetical protein
VHRFLPYCRACSARNSLRAAIIPSNRIVSRYSGWRTRVSQPPAGRGARRSWRARRPGPS